MPLRALMVDVDGVLVRAEPDHGWQRDLARDLDLDPVELNRRFFREVFPLVSLGHADLEPSLAAVLADIAPHVPAATLIDYWFAHDAAVDTVLLHDLDTARASGLEVHLATTQEHRRAEYLRTTLGLADHIDGFHYSADLGVAKPDPEFYRAVERRTGFAPADLLLLDDREENVTAAHAAGWGGYTWTPQSRLTDALR